MPLYAKAAQSYRFIAVCSDSIEGIDLHATPSQKLDTGAHSGTMDNACGLPGAPSLRAVALSLGFYVFRAKP